MQEEKESTAATQTAVTSRTQRGAAFYLLFLALCVSLFLASFEIVRHKRWETIVICHLTLAPCSQQSLPRSRLLHLT